MVLRACFAALNLKQGHHSAVSDTSTMGLYDTVTALLPMCFSLYVYQLALPSPALPGLALWNLGLGELVALALGTHDLCSMRTTTDFTVYIEHVRWRWHCNAVTVCTAPASARHTPYVETCTVVWARKGGVVNWPYKSGSLKAVYTYTHALPYTVAANEIGNTHLGVYKQSYSPRRPL